MKITVYAKRRNLGTCLCGSGLGSTWVLQRNEKTAGIQSIPL